MSLPRLALPPATRHQLLTGEAPAVFPGELARDQFGAPYRSDNAGRFVPLGGPTYGTMLALRCAPIPAEEELRSATILGFYASGDGGEGVFWWNSVQSKAAHNGGTIIDPNHTKVPGAAGWWTAEGTALGCWVRIIGDCYYPEWFGYSDDIGAAINSIIFLLRGVGGKIQLSAKNYSCLTTIDFDLKTSIGAITLCGASSGIRTSGGLNVPTSGTIINGSSMSSTILQAGVSRDNFNIILKDFSIVAGSGSGIILGVDGYSTANSRIQDVDVFGGTVGFQIGDSYGSVIDKIYAFNQTVAGVKLFRCSAALFGVITVRLCQGTWAVEITHSKAIEINVLYTESNANGMLRVDANLEDSLNINSMFTENNNTSGTAEWGILLGDYNGVNAGALSWRIGSLNANGNSGLNPFSQGLIGIDHVFHLLIESMYNRWNRSPNTLAFVPGAALKTLELRNCSLSYREGSALQAKIDLTHAPAKSRIGFNSCSLLLAQIIVPTDETVDINVYNCEQGLTGGGPLERRGLNGLFCVYATESTLLRPYQTLCVVNTHTDTGPSMITLPNFEDAFKEYTIVNEHNMGIDVTVTGNALINGATTSIVAPFTTATYRYNVDRGRWFVISRGSAT